MERIKRTTAKERASSFSSPSIFTVVQPKRLRELTHREHTEENFTKKLLTKSGHRQAP
jgi:hypothetical protein